MNKCISNCCALLELHHCPQGWKLSKQHFIIVIDIQMIAKNLSRLKNIEWQMANLNLHVSNVSYLIHE
jgi:hypothetical protein